MTHHTDAERAEFELMRFAFESKGSEAYKAWLIEVRDGDSYKPWDVVNDWRSWQTAWQAARRAPAAPVPQGWKLVPDDANMTDEQAEAICAVAKVCGGGAYDIYRAALAAAPQPPEAAHVELPEPVAYLHECGKKPSLRTLEFSKVAIQLSAKGYKSLPLYTEQQVRELLAAAKVERDPLTDSEIESATGAKQGTPLFLAAKGFAIAIERAHGIGKDKA